MLVGQDAQVPRGRDRVLRFTVKGEDDDIIDPLGLEAEWILYRGPEHSLAIVKETDAGITYDEDAEGHLVVNVALEGDDTVALEAGRHEHELGLYFPNGTRYVVSRGILTVQPTRLRPPVEASP